MKKQIGYAIVPTGESGLCFTADWTDLTVWQIYKTRKDAKGFIGQKFGDATYEIVKVVIEREVDA